MSETKPKPTPTELIIWSIPAIAAVIFTLVTLVLGVGLPWGLGAILFGVLYFIIRYGNRYIETPDQ
ncbi:MAG: hypothetical protein CMK07_05280 [Ponticaulis sp.]|nr:hypothetical protein [Ponticaulis sp.]